MSVLINNLNCQVGEYLEQGMFQAVAVSLVEFDRDITGNTLANGLDVTYMSVRAHERLHHYLKRQVPERLGWLTVSRVQFHE